MNIKENIKIALFSIKTNLMRSLLTMLGIIIGVAAVIAIITLGNGGRDYIVGMIQDMGANVINIMINTQQAEASDYITTEDIEAIEKLETVSYVSPVVFPFGNASTKHAEGMAVFIGGNADIGYMLGSGMKHGRFFSEKENKSGAHVAIIDTLSAKNMFGYSNPLGEKMTISVGEQTMQVTIIGVVDVSSMMMGGSSSMESMVPMMPEGANSCFLMVPITLADMLRGTTGRYEMCYLMSDTDNQLEAAGNAAMNVLYSRHGNAGSNAYTLTNMSTYIELLDTVINIFTTFIAAVSAISLLVGGIGVMNIMLVTVTERTREIGIRKALGAKTSTILLQFLTESIILCMLGGLIGLIIGAVGAFAVASYLEIPVQMKLSTIAIAVGFSSAIGVFFGIYPAKRAAKMQPIDALRQM